MNLWEFEYLGYYKPGSMSNKSLNFQKYRKGKGHKKDTYASLARVKCNTVYSCDSCNATYGKTPQYGSCNRCNGENFHTVGCGEVSYAEHFTPSLDVEQLFSNPQQSRALTVNMNQHYSQANIGPHDQIVKPVLVMPTAFEYSKNDRDIFSRSDYTYRDEEYETFNRQIPSLNVAYSNKQLMVPNSRNCVAKPKVQKFPISPMRLFRWKAPPRFRCNAYSHRRYDDQSWGAKPILAKKLGTNYWCSTRDQFGRQHGTRFSKKDLGLDNSMVPTITSPNPLPQDAMQPKLYKGSPIWKITLEMRPREYKDETYQYSLYLPGKFSLQKYMEDLSEIPLNQGTIELCPNDPTVEEVL
jgi:hypothetical protein